MNVDDQNLRKNISESVLNALMASRNELLHKFFDPRRNIEEECGHPSTGFISAQDYQDLYDRDAVANRVVQVFPKESWQIPPTVYEIEDSSQQTPFEKAWESLGKHLNGLESWYQESAGNPIWEYLLRADILSGVGQYGVLLIGIDDGKPLNTEVTPVEYSISSDSGYKLTYLRVFPESLAQISQFVPDPTSPRYGHPLYYNLTFNDPRLQNGGIGVVTSTVDVHWSRVIHLADNLGSSEVFGVPRMQPVINRILDLKKLYGGSAEMYWKGAFPGLSLETHPTLGGDVDINRQATRDMMEDYMNGLQRYLALIGMSAKSISPQVVDPSPQINRQIEAICIQLGIPKRVFMGSERGELASTQDDAAWNDCLRGRQRNYTSPKVICPFIDRLIMMGVLPTPKGYSIEWPDLTSQTTADKSAIALSKTQAIAQYVGSNMEKFMTPVDYLTRIIGLSDKEAKYIVDSRKNSKMFLTIDTETFQDSPKPGTPNTPNVPKPKEIKKPDNNTKMGNG